MQSLSEVMNKIDMDAKRKLQIQNLKDSLFDLEALRTTHIDSIREHMSIIDLHIKALCRVDSTEKIVNDEILRITESLF